MKTAFVIDDNALDLRIIKLTLSKYPVFRHVLYFQSGHTVVGYIARHKSDRTELPDVILLDLYMPQYDGWNVLAALDGLQPSLAKPIDIYILSASVSPIDRHRSEGYSFVKGFISKPITQHDLDGIARAAIAVRSATE